MANNALSHRIRRVPDKMRSAQVKLTQVIGATRAQPRELVLYIPEHLSEHGSRPVGYVIEEYWQAKLHQMLGAPWPCPEEELVGELWEQIAAEMEQKSLAFGRYTYGGYSDGDRSLTRAAWCAVRHLQPETVVETGVARGVTSRFVLEALERNGHGGLWSIDLPNLFDATLHDQTGVAVPENRRDRWTYIEGSSRRRLPALLNQIGTVDLFVHDSLHTARNMRYEMDRIWPVLSPGGVMIIDDVYNQSFREFVAQAPNCDALVGRSGDGRSDATCPSDLCWAFGIANKLKPW
jgi:hypothetical protein